jgi:hypothetical protein
MAYCDYGAFVWRNGVRQRQLEDTDIDKKFWKMGITHGLIEDEHIKVICYKQGLPKIFYDDKELDYYDKEKIDYWDFEDFSYDFNDYHFYFHSGFDTYPYLVTVNTPNGDTWVCEYDYAYGAGFEV